MQHTGGRKHYTKKNVIVVVDFDPKFTYVLPSWEDHSMMLTYLLITSQDLMALVSLMAVSTLEMLAMHVGMVVFYPSGKLGTM